MQHLIPNHAPSYADTARQALAFQRKCRRDVGHEVPTVAKFRAFTAEISDGRTDTRAGRPEGVAILNERRVQAGRSRTGDAAIRLFTQTVEG